MARGVPSGRSLLLLASLWLGAALLVLAHPFPIDGTVLELDESNFDSAISSFDCILVVFHSPWCIHCKRFFPELDAAASKLAGLGHQVVIAKIDADKYDDLASKYEITYYPTLKVFMHGIPVDYSGPRRADFLVEYLRKFAAPDVAILDSDSAIHNFVESAGTYFPIFIGFGLDESIIAEFAKIYKDKAWFSVARGFTEDVLVRYGFNTVPAMVRLHPRYYEQSIFNGPFEGELLEDFIKKNNLPLLVPIDSQTLALLHDDKRKIVLTIIQDEENENSLKLAKNLKFAASTNHDLIFAYIGVGEWPKFTEAFGVNKKTKLPKMLVWDGYEEYYLVEGSESLNDKTDQGSQLSRFLEAYRDGRVVHKRRSHPSVIGRITSVIGIKIVCLIVFVVAIIKLMRYITRQGNAIHNKGHDHDTIPFLRGSERKSINLETRKTEDNILH